MTTLATAGAEEVARRRLASVIDGIDGIDLQAEIYLAARFLRAEMPTLPDYSALSADNAAFYDLAVGLGAAINLLAPAIASANDGLASFKTADLSYAFKVPDLAERERWAAEVSQAVGHLANLVNPPSGSRPAFGMFGAAGVARARAKHYCNASSAIRLLVPGGWYF